MALYFISFLFCFASIFLKQAQSKTWTYGFLFCLCLFLCFGYMTGTDWRIYEPMYDKIDLNNLFYNYFAEPGYYIYMLPFKALDIDFFNYLVFTKVLCFICLFRALYKYSAEYRYVAFMFFIPWYAFYLFIDNPLRNLIAISIMALAIPLMIERKTWKFLLVTLLASSIHISAFIMIPLYFVLNRNVPVWLYVLLFLVCNIVFADKGIILFLLNKCLGGIPYVAKKIENYLESNNEFAQGRIVSLGMVIHLAFFCLLMYYKRLFQGIQHGTLIFNGAIVYLLLYRLATTIEVFMRFQLYMSIFYVIAISLLVRAFAKRSRVIYLTGLLCLCFVTCSRLFSDFRYIPYTNYLVYAVKGDFPSFAYRSAYNQNNSPYRNASNDK